MLRKAPHCSRNVVESACVEIGELQGKGKKERH